MAWMTSLTLIFKRSPVKATPLQHPASGVAFTGDRVNISVNDVIQAMGRRAPDYTVAQHRFRFGFILVVPQGAQNSSFTDQVQQVETCLLYTSDAADE